LLWGAWPEGGVGIGLRGGGGDKPRPYENLPSGLCYGSFTRRSSATAAAAVPGKRRLTSR
jgi:hypothetical protein